MKQSKYTVFEPEHFLWSEGIGLGNDGDQVDS